MRMRAAEMLLAPGGAVGRRPAGNVVPFIRRDTEAGRVAPPVIGVDRGDRPAPVVRPGGARWALFLAVSLMLHGGVFAAFHRQAPPLASVGVQSISVELVLGTDAAAGLASKPAESEAAIDSAAAQGAGHDLVTPETARPELKVAEVAPAVAPEAVPRETPPAREVAKPAAVAAAPLLATATPSVATVPSVERVADAPVAQTPQVVAAVPDVALPPPRPEPPKMQRTEPPRKRAAVRESNDTGGDVRTRQSRASVASVASRGIGRGRSDALSNYRGLVAAQLARHKQFPPDARRNGDQGRALVSFTIDDGGRVTRVALLRGTGHASLDREAQAMVHRAAPFPPPPTQQPMRFSVPVSFDLR